MISLFVKLNKTSGDGQSYCIVVHSCISSGVVAETRIVNVNRRSTRHSIAVVDASFDCVWCSEWAVFEFWHHITAKKRQIKHQDQESYCFIVIGAQPRYQQQRAPIQDD